MTYNNNIPLATDQLSVSQDDLLQNFIAIAAAYNLNHGDFNGSNQGEHKYSQYFSQTDDPGTAANQVAVYAKTVNTVAQLFYQPANSATPLNISSVFLDSPTMGRIYLPHGLVLQWGTGTSTPMVSPSMVNFSVPFSTKPYFVVLSENFQGFGAAQNFCVQYDSTQTTATTLYVQNFTRTSAPGNASAVAVAFTYLAIGPV